MRQRLLFSGLLLVLMGLGFEGLGQILTFEFSSLAGDELTANSNFNNSNLTSSTISRGLGLTNTVNGGRFNAENWATTSIANAVTGNDYMEFTITPNLGYQFSVSSIAVQWQRSGTGNTAIALRSSLDNYVSDLDAVKSVTDNTSTQSFIWTFAQANSSTAVTYRLYSYAEAIGGSGGPGDGTGNDIVVNGAVSLYTNDPIIGLSPASLNDFTYYFGEGPSEEQIFVLAGLNLTNDVILTSSDNYEISKNTGSGFTSSLNFTTLEVISPQNVYVRLKSGLPSGSYLLEELSASSLGATSKTITFNGSVKAIYTWNNPLGGSWTTSSNWTPERTTPVATDKLVFSDGNTYTIIDVPSETIDGLNISNNTKVTLNSSNVSATLTINNGSSGNDFSVSSGCELNVAQTSNSPLVFNLETSATGSISGSMNFSSSTLLTPNQLIGADASSIIFNSGATFTQNTNCSGNVFGNGTTGSVVFTNGSSFIQADGNNPFATNNVVVFQTGSLFKVISSSVSTAFSGRSYSNFEMNYNGTITASSTTAFSFDNLTITLGTFNFNMTGVPGHSIKGNITVQSGASLNFNPSSAGTVNFNGTSQQTISGGGTITSNGNSTLFVDNSNGVILDNNANLTGNLTVNSGSLSVKEQRQLTTESLTINITEGIILKSPLDHGAPGSLMVNGSVSGSGTIKAERYIQSYSAPSNGWHLISSPVNNVTIATGTNLAPDGTDDLYAFNETLYEWTNYKPGNVFTNMDNGKGYLVSYAAAETKQFVGTPNNAAVTFSNLTKTAGKGNGWHLIGNPFQSAISWNNGGWTLTNIGGVAKRMSDAGSYTDIQASGIIPAMQGFFVQAEDATNTLTIPLTSRTHNSAQNWTKSGNSNTLLLVAHDPAQSMYQESRLNENPEATEAYDYRFDSRFVTWYAPEFYSISGEEMLSTNSIPDFSQDDVIPFGFKKNASNEFYIELKETPVGLTTYLTDTKTGTEHNFADNAIYSFTSSEGDNPNRFLLHFGAVGIGEQTPSSKLKAYVLNRQLYFHLNGEAVMEVIDLQGRLLESAVVNGQGLVSTPMNQPAGVYVIRLTSNDGVQTAKVVVK